MLASVFLPAESVTFDPDGPGPQAVGNPTSYAQTSGFVFDSQPRTISNLVVDQSAGNPAAVAAAAATPGSTIVSGTRADGTPYQTLFIPNVAPDEGLSAPFNSWMTFFGQFFDHGLDLVTKGGSGTVFIPLQPDDPLFDPRRAPRPISWCSPAPPTSPVLTACSAPPTTSTSTPTPPRPSSIRTRPTPRIPRTRYSCAPMSSMPQAIRSPPASSSSIAIWVADGEYGTADDQVLGGMATWAVVKAQARDILGIELTDADVFGVPLLATDAYGNFLRGPNGFPQVVMRNADGTTSLVEGDPTANGGARDQPRQRSAHRPRLPRRHRPHRGAHCGARARRRHGGRRSGGCRHL